MESYGPGTSGGDWWRVYSDELQFLAMGRRITHCQALIPVGSDSTRLVSDPEMISFGFRPGFTIPPAGCSPLSVVRRQSTGRLRIPSQVYWDLYWSKPDHPRDTTDKLDGTSFNVVMEDGEQVEISFLSSWNLSEAGLPLNIDKRFTMIRGCSGFYSYAIFECLDGGLMSTFLKDGSYLSFSIMFQYMAVSDDRQRIMPTTEDREKGQVLDYPEVVLLTNPSNSFLRGEMFFSTHYAGQSLIMEFQDGEPWKKVFGPVFIYLNSALDGEDPLTLWADAKEQMLIETKSWPYDFPVSEDFPFAEQRGIVSGRLLVHDSYISERLITANSAYIGLAPSGERGSWQTENKGYQFWTQSDVMGYFVITGIRPGNYSLYAWVPGFIGEYNSEFEINVLPDLRILTIFLHNLDSIVLPENFQGSKSRLESLIHEAPRNGPTIWEIGITDRTAAEFFVPDPNPSLMNQLYVAQTDKIGVLVREIDVPNVWDVFIPLALTLRECTRKVGNKVYIPTWKIVFNLTNVDESANYTLQLALASVTDAELQVRIHDETTEETPHFSTGLIGKDNAIARHGIHGLYWLYSVDIPSSLLVGSTNTIFLTQSRGSSPWRGIMYDYIRLEAPPSNIQT
ncbi:hypothetical protein OROGR_019114 [Orobanche gracilis]